MARILRAAFYFIVCASISVQLTLIFIAEIFLGSHIPVYSGGLKPTSHTVQYSYWAQRLLGSSKCQALYYEMEVGRMAELQYICSDCGFLS